MNQIRIDAPGAGEWVMDQLGSRFMPGIDHVFSSHQGDEILGGFVLNWFLGGSITVHCASQNPRWFTRELAWLMFHYSFVQLGVHKMLTPMASDEHRLLSMYMRAGWKFETHIRDAYGPDKHMLILTMTKDDCPWLRYKPKLWTPHNKEAA